jgi:hypothetical protein
MLACNNGRRWWYLLDADETDDSSLANLFGTIKQKLTELMVGANLAYWHGKSAPTLRIRTNNIYDLCVESQINIDQDLSTLTSYTCKKRVIRIGEGEGPMNARNQFSDEYLDPPRISHRCPRRLLLLDRLDRLLQPETEEQEEEEAEEEEEQPQESLACTEEVQHEQSIKEVYLTQRDATLTNNFLLSVLGPSGFQHDVLMQQVNVFAILEKGILDTANKLRELKPESSKSMLGAIGATATIEEEKLTRGHCPTLTSLCVDLSTDVHAKSLLRDIVRLHKDVPLMELLIVASHWGLLVQSPQPVLAGRTTADTNGILVH